METCVENLDDLKDEVKEGLDIEEEFSLSYVNNKGKTCIIKTAGNFKMFVKRPPPNGDLYHATVVLASASSEALEEEESPTKVGAPLNRLLKSISSTSDKQAKTGSKSKEVLPIKQNNGVWAEHINIDMCGEGD